MRRIVVTTLVIVSLVAIVAGLSGYVYALRSLPQIEGTIRVSGLESPVDIIRDSDHVPHIFGSTRNDALFGLGYAHAQDRLWQMEFQRRIGHGRLSEIFGKATVTQDRFLRTVGFGRAAQSAVDRMPADARQQIDSYVAGINAFLNSHQGSRLPPEFTLLGLQPEPWTGADVVVWGKMMAWELGANYSFELLRADIEATLGLEAVEELLPPYPKNGLSIVTMDARSALATTPADKAPARLSTSTPGGALGQAFARGLSTGHPAVRRFLLGGSRIESLGSNNWVVDGTLTASGKPMLANDPHLGARIPSTWYLAHMSAGDLDVIGATLPGVPSVTIGRNQYIAWGATNVAADVQDLFRERLDSSGTAAEFRGVMEPLAIFTETIRVKGGDAVDVTVRVSRHGPLVSDAINANNAESGRGMRPLEPLAFQWTALDVEDETIVAFLRLNEASNWTEFREALGHFVTPSQNFVYADVDGHIGYYAPGHIPIRAHGDGSRPSEGWSGEMEWLGWIPFDQLPHTFDPPEHFIVTANHRPASPGYGHFIALEFPEPYRAERTTALLSGATALTPNDFQAIQADTLSLHARTLLPILLDLALPQTAADRMAVELLRGWDFNATGSSAPAAIFQAWFLRLAPVLLRDDLGDAVLESYHGRFSHVTRFAVNTLRNPEDPWCDDSRTSQWENCGHAVTTALQEGIASLSETVGTDMGRWRWDDVHRAVFPHRGLDAVAGWRPILSRSVPSAGDWSTVNMGATSADRPFEQHSVPSYRQVVDLSPINDSWFLDAVGQSGHFLSRHYDDFLDDWRHVRYRQMRMSRSDIEADATGRLRLVPE
jgi:penicillin amidase